MMLLLVASLNILVLEVLLGELGKLLALVLAERC